MKKKIEVEEVVVAVVGRMFASCWWTSCSKLPDGLPVLRI
jgi:hypothetical protein